MNLPASPYYTERKHRSYRDRFTIIWMATRRCNFDCAYCYGTKEPDEKFDVDEFVECLRTKFPQPIRLCVTGGEPLLFPWMVELCQKVGAIGGTIEMQTNFSLNAREFIDNTSPDYIEIIETSYHPRARERWNENGCAKFIQDFHYAQSKGFNITTWMIDDPRIPPETFLKDCRMLHDCGITPMRKRYCGEECGTHIGDAIYVEGKVCLAGYGGANLWENFDVTVCDHDRTVLGNLFGEMNLKTSPEPCAMRFCGCLGREWLVDKFHDDYYNRDFGGAYEPDLCSG